MAYTIQTASPLYMPNIAHTITHATPASPIPTILSSLIELLQPHAMTTSCHDSFRKPAGHAKYMNWTSKISQDTTSSQLHATIHSASPLNMPTYSSHQWMKNKTSNNKEPKRCGKIPRSKNTQNIISHLWMENWMDNELFEQHNTHNYSLIWLTRFKPQARCTCRI